jgi:large repetitive protein
MARMLTSALPYLAVALPVGVYAAAVSNTATVTVSSGSFDRVSSNDQVTHGSNVLAAITVANGSVSGANGASGATAVVNAFTGNTLNGTAAAPSNALLAIAHGSAVPTGLVFIPATGTVDVVPGTPAGTYSFDYRLCEALNPTNCQTGTITVGVVASAVTVAPATAGGVNGSTGSPSVLNVLTGATVNADPATPTNTILTLPAGTILSPGIGFDPATGTVSVAPATPAGTYSFDVLVCERLNPANCVTMPVVVTVANAGPVGVADSATMVRGNPVTIDVLANDSEPDGDRLTVTATSAPAHGTVTINADGTVTYTPVDSYVGTDSFTYTVCDTAGQCVTETVSLIVHPSVSALNGVVYLDENADRTRSATDPRQPNWLVEIVRNGVVVATTRTDANGFYQIENLPLGSGYSVVFRHPTTGVAYGRTDGVTLNAGIVSVDLDRPIDPSGVAYDSVSRTPIEGVRVTMVDANGVPLPVGCFLDGSQQGQLTGSDGRYRIDLVPNGAPQCPATETRYRILITGPADTLPGLSTIILPEAGPFDPTGLSSPVSIGDGINAPQGSETTRHYYEFRLGSGDPDIINNHIPLDRANALAQMLVTKTSPKRTASIGELVPYTIVVRNPQAVTRTNVDVVDVMPAGFQYVANSGRVNAATRAPAITGRELNWRSLVVPANGSVTISLMLTPGAGVRDGDQVNLADSRDALSGRVLSNQGQATVRITPSPLFDCSEIIGKVFDDRNGNGYQDDGEPGVAGARVATVNGLLVTADQYGRYHISCAAVPNAQMGSNFILKLDPRSLPAGYNLTTENPRVVRVTRGKMVEIDFGVRGAELVTFELNDTAFAEGSNSLKPEWAAKLAALIETLKAQPSRLRLNYSGDGDAKEKLEQLAAQIAASWKDLGGKHELDIEWTTSPPKAAGGEGR